MLYRWKSVKNRTFIKYSIQTVCKKCQYEKIVSFVYTKTAGFIDRNKNQFLYVTVILVTFPILIPSNKCKTDLTEANITENDVNMEFEEKSD